MVSAQYRFWYRKKIPVNTDKPFFCILNKSHIDATVGEPVLPKIIAGI